MRESPQTTHLVNMEYHMILQVFNIWWSHIAKHLYIYTHILLYNVFKLCITKRNNATYVWKKCLCKTTKKNGSALDLKMFNATLWQTTASRHKHSAPGLLIHQPGVDSYSSNWPRHNLSSACAALQNGSRPWYLKMGYHPHNFNICSLGKWSRCSSSGWNWWNWWIFSQHVETNTYRKLSGPPWRRSQTCRWNQWLLKNAPFIPIQSNAQQWAPQ